MNNKWQNNQSENLVVVVPQKGKSPSDAGFLIFMGAIYLNSWKNKAKMNS